MPPPRLARPGPAPGRVRRLPARDQLRAARDTFDQLGNQPFSERARDELRATGEASPQRQNVALDELTPQEVRIARLVAEGLSNKQIGERMFLSHRTIASHLYQIFPKLGVTSRAQLPTILVTETGESALATGDVGIQ